MQRLALPICGADQEWDPDASTLFPTFLISRASAKQINFFENEMMVNQNSVLPVRGRNLPVKDQERIRLLDLKNNRRLKNLPQQYVISELQAHPDVYALRPSWVGARRGICTG